MIQNNPSGLKCQPIFTVLMRARMFSMGCKLVLFAGRAALFGLKALKHWEKALSLQSELKYNN